MKRVLLLALVALQVSAGFAAETKLRILARVGDTSISNREILIEWILKNPKSYVPGRREYYSSDVEKQLLQEYIVQVLVQEENHLVGTQTLSANVLERRLLDVRKGFGPRWPAFRKDFEISEAEVKVRLSRSLLSSQTLETRLRDALIGSKGESDSVALKKAEDGLQTWLQQLRSRYKVQILRYEDSKEPVASP